VTKATLDYGSGPSRDLRSSPAAISCALLSAFALVFASGLTVRSALLLREASAARRSSSAPTNWVFGEPRWVRPNWLETNAWAFARLAAAASAVGALIAMGSLRLRPPNLRAWPFLSLGLCNAILLIMLLLFWLARGFPEIRSA
jgi:hypothetical protein